MIWVSFPSIYEVFAPKNPYQELQYTVHHLYVWNGSFLLSLSLSLSCKSCFNEKNGSMQHRSSNLIPIMTIKSWWVICSTLFHPIQLSQTKQLDQTHHRCHPRLYCNLGICPQALGRKRGWQHLQYVYRYRNQWEHMGYNSSEFLCEHETICVLERRHTKKMCNTSISTLQKDCHKILGQPSPLGQETTDAFRLSNCKG